MKNKGIQQIFSEVPATYELVNHLLTLGLDIVWRRQAAKLASRLRGDRWLDCCCGTGEMAVNLRRRMPEGIVVYGADFSQPMIAKAKQKKIAANIRFMVADIKTLPVPDNTFDLITISFATRNINLSQELLVASFEEFYRILKPGGSLINLETSQPASNLIRLLFHLYVKIMVRPIGYVISGSRVGYGYLAHTIPRFYPPQQLAGLLGQAGFKIIKIKKLLFGVTAIHHALK